MGSKLKALQRKATTAETATAETAKPCEACGVGTVEIYFSIETMLSADESEEGPVYLCLACADLAFKHIESCEMAEPHGEDEYVEDGCAVIRISAYDDDDSTTEIAWTCCGGHAEQITSGCFLNLRQQIPPALDEAPPLGALEPPIVMQLRRP